MIDKHIERELNKFSIKRDSKLGVGKRIGDQVWVHKDYALSVMPKIEFDKASATLPDKFKFEIIRLSNNGDIGFISSPDFNKSSEPIVSCSFKVIRGENGEYSVSRMTKEQKNPLIYHHKWLFVKDDFEGFSCNEAKLRSYEWKVVLGVNRTVSSKIGRLSFWNDWLKEKGINPRVSSNPDNSILLASVYKQP